MTYGPITIYELREHWRDRNAACNQLRAYRDTVRRFYWFYRWAPDHGRRWRGRMLDRANREFGWARRQCLFCRCDVWWSPTFTGPGQGAPR